MQKHVRRPVALSNRKRTFSLLSVSSSRSSKITLDLSKATPSVLDTARPEKQDAFGAFVPTSSASESLICIAHSSGKSFVSQLRPHSLHRPPHHIFPESPKSEPSSGPSSPTTSESYVPFISRTSSSYSDSCVSTPPTSPSTSTFNFDVVSANQKETANADLDPVLATLEKSSRFCKRKAYCATCYKPGTSYPSCARCGEMWCSRECRLVGGKKHVCSKNDRSRQN